MPEKTMPEKTALASEAISILYRSVGHVIETMCFAQMTGVPSRLAPKGEKLIVSTISFDGPFQGRLQVAVETGAASLLLASFLGAPRGSDPMPSQSAAMICELNHMICGRFLSWLFPAEEICMSPAALDEPRDAEGSVLSQHFLLDSGSLTASVQIDRLNSACDPNARTFTADE